MKPSPSRSNQHAHAPAVTGSPVGDFLRELHRRVAEDRSGNVATYIPGLAKANPDWFGIALVTADGQVYEVGDSAQEFTIQSISKPFVYGMALEDNTRAEVLRKVGVEPTGDVFNAISLEAGTGRPRNPMINAGAIATTGMIAGKSPAGRLKRILETFSLYAGRTLEIDKDIYQSENETGHRNRAIGHLLRNFDIVEGDPTPIVDLYFKQCSISVNCRDLAVMAATLANRGVNPITGKQAIRGEYVESVLSVMASSGMYDYAGEWIYRVGMPAKSGVAGGIIAVLPGQLGLGIFSPPLDPRGNSVRGIQVCDELSRHFDLHQFHPPHSNSSVVRLKFTGADVTSSRQRSNADTQTLRESGPAIQVWQLQGNLVFSTVEVVVRHIIASSEGMQFAIVDFKHALSLNEAGSRLFLQLLEQLAAAERTLLFTHAARVPALRRYLRQKLGDRFEELFRVFEENDLALEWCENRLMESPTDEEATDSVDAGSYGLFEGLNPHEIKLLTGVMQRQSFRRGQVVVEFGAEARELFFIAAGNASVTVTLAGGTQKRLATFSSGMSFGEMALLDGAPRSAVVTADTALVCDMLPLADFRRLGREHPRIEIVLLQNIALGLCQKLRKLNREISVFDY